MGVAAKAPLGPMAMVPVEGTAVVVLKASTPPLIVVPPV